VTTTRSCTCSSQCYFPILTMHFDLDDSRPSSLTRITYPSQNVNALYADMLESSSWRWTGSRLIIPQVNISYRRKSASFSSWLGPEKELKVCVLLTTYSFGTPLPSGASEIRDEDRPRNVDVTLRCARSDSAVDARLCRWRRSTTPRIAQERSRRTTTSSGIIKPLPAELAV